VFDALVHPAIVVNKACRCRRGETHLA